jgi:hypothetical protein
MLTANYVCGDITSMNPLDIKYFTVAQYPAPIEQYVPGIPKAVVEVIALLMAKNKDDRVQVSYPSSRQ